MKHIPWMAAAVVLAVHLAANAHYGFFRDELYFIICGRHPDFGYVDQPPVVPLLAALTQRFGDSLFLLRAVPALFAAGGAFVVCLLVREFGGGRFAEAFAAFVYLLTPVLAAFGGKVGPDEVGLALWPLLALVIVRVARGADARLWLAAGAIAGVCLQSKYSIVFFAAAITAGLLLTRERRILFTPWFGAGIGVAILIALPNVLWQGAHGWPMLELLHNGVTSKNLNASVPVYLVQELLITSPLLAPVWIAGVVWLLRSAAYRFLGYAYLLLILEMLVLHGKHYYPANVYPIAIAAGAVPLEAWTSRVRAFRPLAFAYVAIAGLVFLPDALPILSEPDFIAFASARNAALHVPTGATETERGRDHSALPGDWADMHGWPEMAKAVRAVYDGLSPAERREAVVFAGNYGEAAAVNFYEPQIPVISEHNQYWLWGSRGFTGSVVVQINGSCFHSDGYFGSRTHVRTLSTPYAIGFETGIPIWICRQPRKSLAEIWPSIKDYE